MLRSPANQRPRYQRDPEDTSLDGSAEGPAIPASCLRVLHSPIGDECPMECPGRQQDGTCLTEIVKESWERTGRWPTLDLDRFDNWIVVDG